MRTIIFTVGFLIARRLGEFDITEGIALGFLFFFALVGDILSNGYIERQLAEFKQKKKDKKDVD